ncbi:MAG TPA: helix-hairpin-helix domain-containing protein [Acidimicrobiia bacterium]|nr:helix-hairpin-helix domain-containing protein [Acidimicrobiia bacterium]
MDRRWLLAGGVAVLALATGAWFGRGVVAVPAVPVAPHAVDAPVGVASPPERLVVHVTGWVVHPGVVEVTAGSRLGDALAAAGGVRAGASLDSVNLAETLVDGQQVVVPGPGPGPGPDANAGAGAAGGLIRLNSATAQDLEALPGVGPVLAERIVAHREERGPFETVEDLLEVPGIGESKLASIRELVAVP